MEGKHAVVSALPYYLNTAVAAAARETGLHYFDLTEDVETTRAVSAIADGADSAFMPQCGLAPGFISIVAHDLARRFDSLETVRMRVGALPQFPTNALNYNLTWSTDGLINEYCNPCEAIHEGKRIEVLALQGIEQFSLDGVTYEAFNTSGGLGTLCETLDGKVKELNYKTVRYPGHCDLMKLLCDDLRLGERRELFKDVLETAIPMTDQDVVLVFATVTGQRAGRLTQESYANKTYSQDINGGRWSAIQITTAAGICTMVDLMREGALPARGFLRQEDVALDTFLGNRFGQYYG
jgi:saccharopine dehydrogenase-like NADP-dependent oxidoreductase